MDRTVRLNHPNQVETHPDDGTVTITEQNGDRVTLAFAHDSHAFELAGAIADARAWKHQAEEQRMERELVPDGARPGGEWYPVNPDAPEEGLDYREPAVDWFEVAKAIIGQGEPPDERVSDLGQFTRAAIRDAYTKQMR